MGTQRGNVFTDEEVTIADFANAVLPRAKMCKRKSVNSFDLSSISKELEEDWEETETEINARTKKHKLIKKRRKKNIRNEKEKNHVYNDYNLDIWRLISECIRPEDVGTFALICRKTESIVASPIFWIKMYKRNYTLQAKFSLPIELQPDCIKRFGGLRARVIRSLFYTYKPFLRRLQKKRTNYDSLNGLQCIGSWCKQEEKSWIYYFKFFTGIKTRSPQITDEMYNKSNDNEDEELDNFLARFNNIFDNLDEGCHILVFTANRYYPIPNFLGFQRIYLSLIRQPISRELTEFNLELHFSNYLHKFIGCAVFPSVFSVRVVDWWSPDYHLLSNPL